MSELSLQLLHARDAIDWLESPIGQASWDQLYRTSSWRFPTLGPDYYRLWFKYYGDVWEPLLAVAKDSKDSYCAIFPLAVDADSITGAGAHQAEYQGWLSDTSLAEAFLRAVLAGIRKRFPNHALRIKYLAPGIPQQIVHAACAGNVRTEISTHPRPLLRLDPAALTKALRKKNTRSKINRLRREGNLALVRITEREAIEKYLDQVIPLYDFRQGAANDSCPFTDDPKKRAFLLEWIRTSPTAELHFTCLQLNGQVIGAHIGVISDKECQLAILAHDPRYTSCSPGKLQIYSTAEMLAGEGLSFLDLTPGGDPWKERFATEHDTVLSLHVFKGTFQAYRHRLQSLIAKLARSLLRRAGIAPSQLRSWIHGLLPIHQIRAPASRKEHDSSTVSYVLTPQPEYKPPEDRSETVLGTELNALDDLCLYRPGRDGVSRRDFLLHALSRLEQGLTPYTLARGDQLKCCAWVDLRKGPRKEDPCRVTIQDLYSADDQSAEVLKLIDAILYEHLGEEDNVAILRIAATDEATTDRIKQRGFGLLTESGSDAALATLNK